MVWFVKNVFPRVLQKLLHVQLHITGDNAGLSLPSSPNITLTGYVENIGSLIASSTVSIAPMLSGGGTRLKILEAMAIGTPVVATTKGVEGLDASHGEHLLVADTPEAFADCIISLCQDQELHKQISSAARKLVIENYDWDRIMPRFYRLLEQFSHE
jgi:glycosyltransferase involved in cell wall biosynthesis